MAEKSLEKKLEERNPEIEKREEYSEEREREWKKTNKRDPEEMKEFTEEAHESEREMELRQSGAAREQLKNWGKPGQFDASPSSVDLPSRSEMDRRAEEADKNIKARSDQMLGKK